MMGRIFTTPVILTMFIMISPIQGGNILLIPYPWKSHLVISRVLADEMTTRGHSVSVLLHPKVPAATFQGVNVDLMYHKTPNPDSLTHPLASFVESVRGKSQVEVYLHTELFATYCSNMLTDEGLLEDIRARDIDMVLLDSLPISRCNVIIPYRLGLRFSVQTVTFEPWLQRVPTLPSTFPFQYSGHYTASMTFRERLHNTWLMLKWVLLSPTSKVLSDQFLHQFIPDDMEKKSVVELMAQSELWFIETDILVDYPRPTMPNEVFVGGITTSTAQPLPEEFQTFMDDAENGVIVVSFGSADAIPTSYVPLLKSVFEKLTQFRIVWRSTKVEPPVADHILVSQWLPQNSLLAHPHTSLFITHCGNNGQMEALYHGKPMLGIPIMVDQFYNSRRIQYHGYGDFLDLVDLTEQSLEQKIRNIITNDSYRQNVQKASEIFHSRPDTPSERLVNAVDDALQHGTSHLRHHGLDMPWWQYVMMDIAALGIGVLVLLVLLARVILGVIWSRCCKKDNSEKLKQL